jgi:hypothetical protein
MRARGRFLVGSSLALVALLAFPSPLEATDYDSDVRLRYSIYLPEDLPTDEGTVVAIEFRHLLTEADGLYVNWWFSTYDEQRSDTRVIGGDDWFFEAEIEMASLVVGWFHLWRLTPLNLAFGAGGGLYDIEAFSGGYRPGAPGQLPGQASDYEEFRQIDDGTRFGFQFYGGADFFPSSRWGAMVEVRYHVVEDELGGLELSTGALFRF